MCVTTLTRHGVRRVQPIEDEALDREAPLVRHSIDVDIARKGHQKSHLQVYLCAKLCVILNAHPSLNESGLCQHLTKPASDQAKDSILNADALQT
jgi:hypothetical protein